MSEFGSWLSSVPGLPAAAADPSIAQAGVEFETEDGLVRIEPCGPHPQVRLGFMVDALDLRAPSGAGLVLELHEFNAQARWAHDGWVTIDEVDQLWLNLILPIEDVRASMLDRLLRQGFEVANRMAGLLREEATDGRRARLQALIGGLQP
ncbi:MAG: hypothetical protein KGR68_19100 [Betaproteobacteria bacterium]|nr:hypothetical protein [Betaproteobacteria bacterium]